MYACMYIYEQTGDILTMYMLWNRKMEISHDDILISIVNK